MQQCSLFSNPVSLREKKFVIFTKRKNIVLVNESQKNKNRGSVPAFFENKGFFICPKFHQNKLMNCDLSQNSPGGDRSPPSGSNIQNHPIISIKLLVKRQ